MEKFAEKKPLNSENTTVKPGLPTLSFNNVKCSIIRTDLKKIPFKSPYSQKSNLCISAKKKLKFNTSTNDRYIPRRIVSNMEIGYHLLYSKNDLIKDRVNQVDQVKRILIDEMCNGISNRGKILNFHETEWKNRDKSFQYLNGLIKKNTKRYISPTPILQFDVPNFRNNFYLNLIDWSCQNNLALPLEQDLLMFSFDSRKISKLFSMDSHSSNYICSTSWQLSNGHILAVGNSKNIVELWDSNTQTCLRQMNSHKSRIGSLSWNNYILTSGSRSGDIHHYDVRVAQHHVGTLKMHEQEVCGLKWNNNGRYLASGSNDNLALVWDANFSNETSQPLHVFREHTAAVKGLAWCPWQNSLLATGGGSSDQHIKLWNVNSGNLIQSIDSMSPISCLLWSKYYKELISSHGYSKNQLTIWSYPEMIPNNDLVGHHKRVLMMAMSPDGKMVASVSADETIKIWQLFKGDNPNSSCKNSNSNISLFNLK